MTPKGHLAIPVSQNAKSVELQGKKTWTGILKGVFFFLQILNKSAEHVFAR